MKFKYFGFLILGIFLSIVYLVYYIKTRKDKIPISIIPQMKTSKKTEDGFCLGLEDILFILVFFFILFIFIGFSNPYIDSEVPKNGVNVIFLIDNSGTMQQNIVKKEYGNITRLDIAKNISKTLLKSLDSEDYIAIVEFKYDVKVPLCLSNPNLNQVQELIDSIGPSDEIASLADGIYEAVDLASLNSESAKLILLLSDGIHHDRIFTLNQSLEHAKEKKVPIYTINVGSKDLIKFGYGISEDKLEAVEKFLEPDNNTLKYISDASGGVPLDLDNFESLENIYEQFRKEIKKEKEPYYLGIYSFAFAFLLFLIYLILTELRSMSKKNETI